MTGFKLSLLSLFLLLVSCSGADQISDKIHPTIELDSSVSHTWVGYDNISKNDRQDFYYFSADFTVPEPPSNNTDTSLVLFIWPGIGNQGTDSRAKNILQPVLAWATPREKPTGWYLMNAWYSHNPQLDNQPVYKTSPTHAVSTGDKLTGKIQLCPTQYNNSGWTISFDNSSGEEISGIT